MSASIMARNSSDDVPPGLTAMVLSLALTSGSRIACRSAVSSFLAIAGGVFALVKKPLHSLVLTSGKPDSAMLGTSGNSAERSAPVTASARTLPPFTIGTAGGPSAIANRQFSAATQRIISLLLFHGIATPGIPVFSFNSSDAIVKAGDVVA